MAVRDLIDAYLFFWAGLIVRRRRPFIVGVTGSAGKTTTTEMIAGVLQHEAARPIVGTVAHTLRNMNDDRGLPLTLLRYDRWPGGGALGRLKLYSRVPFRALELLLTGRYPDVLVLEYGTHWHGHLARLAKLAPPKLAVVTNIGPAHLDRLKTIDAIVREKGSLVQAVPPSGLVVLGDGHDHVDQLQNLARAPVVRVSGRGLDLSANIARSVARHLRVPNEIVEAALTSFEPPAGRLKLLRLNGLTVLDDSYNANPLSMTLAVETLSATAAAGKQRRLAILGAMAELGEEAPRYHREAGTLARSHADLLIGVGELAKCYEPDHWYPTSSACADDVERLLAAEDCILVKGAHSAHMERVVLRLKEIGQRGIAPVRGNRLEAGSRSSPAPMDASRQAVSSPPSRSG